MCNISMDTAATGIFVHICVQLDMLKNSLENMKKNAINSLYAKKQLDNKELIITNIEESALGYSEAELEKEMELTFINCIKHHYAILS